MKNTTPLYNTKNTTPENQKNKNSFKKAEKKELKKDNVSTIQRNMACIQFIYNTHLFYTIQHEKIEHEEYNTKNTTRKNTTQKNKIRKIQHTSLSIYLYI